MNLKAILLIISLFIANVGYSQTVWNDVAPIFAANCSSCHTTNSVSGVNLNSYAAAIASVGAQYGSAVIVANSAATSPLVDKIANASPANGSQMPTTGALSAANIALIQQWINDGALEEVLLPIELSEFEAKTKESEVLLSWTTLSETNNSYFDIERSSDGQNFERLIKLEGQGNSIELTNYKYVDNTPYIGKNYYRLKQVDFNGNYEYSNTILAQIKQPNSISIHPNPTKGDKIFVELKTPSKGVVTIHNLQGQLIHRETLINEKQRWLLNTPELAQGIYIVEFYSNDEKYVQKLIVQ